MRVRFAIGCALCALLASGIWLWSRKGKGAGELPPLAAANAPATPPPGEPITPSAGTGNNITIDRELAARFEREVAPQLDKFLTRLAALSTEGALPPLTAPVTTGRLTSLKFIGGASNTVATFIVDGRSVFHYQAARREDLSREGITSFWNVGKDADGTPLNVGQLTEDPVGNAKHLQKSTDTNAFPARTLASVAPVAQSILAAIGPPDHKSYVLKEKWREQAGAAVLPFYTFVFLRQGFPSEDPANVFRDEVMIRLKSTATGFVLDHYQDNSIVFAAGTRPGAR